MRFLFLTLFLFLTCCAQTKTASSEPRPGDMAYQIIGTFSKEMREKGFYLSLVGGKFGSSIDHFNLGYHAQQKLNLQEARKTVVSTISRFLKLINENEQIRSALEEYPFSARGIYLNIHFLDEKKNEFTDGSISSVHVIYLHHVNKTMIYYKVYNPELDDRIQCHEETYEEAEKIVLAEGRK